MGSTLYYGLPAIRFHLSVYIFPRHLYLVYIGAPCRRVQDLFGDGVDPLRRELQNMGSTLFYGLPAILSHPYVY